MVAAGDKQSIVRSGGTWLPPKFAAKRRRLPRSKHTRVMLAGAVSRTISDGSCNCGDSRAGDRIARHCR